VCKAAAIQNCEIPRDLLMDYTENLKFQPTAISFAYRREPMEESVKKREKKLLAIN